MNESDYVREPFPHPTPKIEDVIAKLRWSVESGEWSARVTPEEAAILLARLADGPNVP